MKARNLLLFLATCMASIAIAQPARTPDDIDPSRFDEEIAAFEAKDRAEMPPEGAIVVTGSSSIRRWTTIEEDLAPLTVIPRGFGGSTMADLLHFIDRIVIPYEPRAVVIYEGDNDTGSYHVPPSQIADELNQIITVVRKNQPETRFYVISVKPSVSRWEYWDVATETNKLYQQIAAQDDNVFYIDIPAILLDENGIVMDDIFVEDNLHLNEKGTRMWAHAIKAALMPIEAQYE